MRKTLEEMRWNQLNSPIQTYNLAAAEVVNNTILLPTLKATDRRLHWLICRESQCQFRYYWAIGSLNLEEYITKNHRPLQSQSKKM